MCSSITQRPSADMAATGLFFCWQRHRISTVGVLAHASVSTHAFIRLLSVKVKFLSLLTAIEVGGCVCSRQRRLPTREERGRNAK